MGRKVDTRALYLDALLFASGVLLLLAGATFYVFFRAEPVAFMQWAGISPAADTLRIDESDFGWIPSFAHAAAFTLLTAAWLERRIRYIVVAAAGWFTVNVAFEVLQLLPEHLAVRLPGALASFAAAGTFDPLDIAGAGSGAVLAALACWTMIAKQSA